MKSLTLVPNAVPGAQTVTIVPVPLHDLINQLMAGLLPLTIEKKSFIINDVDRDFSLQSDEQVLAFVLGNLLSGAVNGSENVCIRVETVLNDECIQIRVRNNGAYFYSTAANSFALVVKAARQLGGNISIYNQKNQGTTLTLSIATQKIAC
jgi:C4-dicarboxylate-specific signal transduction histidine kinase